jgi:hypothetical protein
MVLRNVYLNAEGRFTARDDGPLDGAPSVPPEKLIEFLQETLSVPTDTTDVFVIVHGWRNDIAQADQLGSALVDGLKSQWREHADLYPHLRRQRKKNGDERPFKPAFVILHWPSTSSAFGYATIRERSQDLTRFGLGEHSLSALLGYLFLENPKPTPMPNEVASEVIPSRDPFGVPMAADELGGYFVHAIGHSFGGRFLTAAITHAGSPSDLDTIKGATKARELIKRRLEADPSLARVNGFPFWVDSLTVFQMAAPQRGYGPSLRALIADGAFHGPVALTYTKNDSALTLWHPLGQLFSGEVGEIGIGGAGARQPEDLIEAADLALQPADQTYPLSAFTSSRILNLNADQVFTRTGIDGGAHSDILHPESAHLILSVAEACHRHPELM